MDDILLGVKARIETLGLSLKDAADEIGVTAATLERHLTGAYVRSDSLAKYRAWLEGRRARTKPLLRSLFADLKPPEDEPSRTGGVLSDLPFPVPPFDRAQPYLVVDLFSGCGGMSLGFDLLSGDEKEGTVSENGSEGVEPLLPGRSEKFIFQTVLALDIEEKVVRLHNQNHPPCPGLQRKPARWVDIADFMNAGEILAFYLDHFAICRVDARLANDLDRLPCIPLSAFKMQVQRLDGDFLASLNRIRSTSLFKQEYSRIDSVVFGQTSVIGFHEALGLPDTSTTQATLGPLLWADPDSDPGLTVGLPEVEDLPGFTDAHRAATIRLAALWDAEVKQLRARTTGNGKGQLASSAGRIGRFLEFLATDPAQQIREAWLNWRSRRDALREVAFGDERIEDCLRAHYREGRRVDVLLGGPPCQGFSRIGRGKIRSLREYQVHVETDPEAGDERNLLLLKYVLFVSALEPRIFLFENVRHFQASVKTPDGTFLATEILHDAIKELSNNRLDYQVKDRIVDCSRHLIPQTRERYVMAGVRSDVRAPSVAPELLPEWCLTLSVHDPVPLRDALAGLAAPLLARGQRSAEEGGMSGTVSVSMMAGVSGPAGFFLQWVRQQAHPSLESRSNLVTDGHYIREPRADDQAFFELLGPGQRWMDYRCDCSATLQEMRSLLERLKQTSLADSPEGASLIQTVDSVMAKLDGSLSIRLLLESIDPLAGELQHHLLTPAYLGKREGNNGDWIARLHPDRPCRTIVSHMAKDTYTYVHPSEPRTLSVREAARIQTFPDWFRFGSLGLVDAFRAVGNAVPPLLSHQFARRIARLLQADDAIRSNDTGRSA